MPWSAWYDYTMVSVNSKANAMIGVYELANSTVDTVYYGTGIIKDKLKLHLDKNEFPSATYFRYEQTMDEKTAFEKKQTLLRDYTHRYRKLPVYNRRARDKGE